MLFRRRRGRCALWARYEDLAGWIDQVDATTVTDMLGYLLGVFAGLSAVRVGKGRTIRYAIFHPTEHLQGYDPGASLQRQTDESGVLEIFIWPSPTFCACLYRPIKQFVNVLRAVSCDFCVPC